MLDVVFVIDRLDESNCTRQIGPLVSQYLQEKSHGVNQLRIDKSNSSIALRIVILEQIKQMK